MSFSGHDGAALLYDVVIDLEFDTKIDNYVVIACLKCEPTCKLIKRITGSCLFISRLPGLALRPHVESLGKHRDSTSIFKVLPDKKDIKKISKYIQLVFSIYKSFDSVRSKRV